MELDQQRLILGTDRPEDHLGAILGGPGSDVLRGVRADGQSREVRDAEVGSVDDHPGIQRQEPLGRGEQGIDVNLLDPLLLDDQMAEPDQELLEGSEVDRPATADSLECGVDLRLLHHPPSQGGVEQRQGQRAVLENFDELAAGTEEEHRSELGIEAAADDDLVAVELDHRLDADSLEVLGAGAGAPKTRWRGTPRALRRRLSS